MKKMLLILSIFSLAIVLPAQPGLAQDLDVFINPSNVNFNPPGPVPPGTPVQITIFPGNQSNSEGFCDIYIGIFNGSFFTDIAFHNRVFFPPNQPVQVVSNWNTSGLAATTQPVIVDVFNCVPQDVNRSNNQTQVDYELPVELAWFGAWSEQGGTTLAWRTESEIANHGFYIYRSEQRNGSFERVNQEIIPGAGTTAFANNYRFFDREAAPGQTWYYYLEDISLSGASETSMVIGSRFGSPGEFEQIDIELEPRSFSEADNDKKTSVRQTTLTFSSDTSLKISVEEQGLVRVTHGDIKDAGVVPESIPIGSLRITNKGQEIPVMVSDGGDGVLDPGDYLQFEGTFNQGTFTYEDVQSRINVYWVSWSGENPGTRIAGFEKEQGTGPYPVTTHLEKNPIYSRLGFTTDVNRDHFFWKRIDSPNTESFEVVTENLAEKTAAIRVMLHGNSHLSTNPDHFARIFFNGDLLGEVSWDGQEPYLFETSLGPSALVEGENTLSVQAVGQGLDSIFFNWMELDYWSAAQQRDKVVSPESVALYEPGNLKSADNGADYVVITHEDFMDSATMLADYRQVSGYATAVVNVEDLYAEFSNGLVDYKAIIDFLKYAYENWNPSPSYAVLLGDAYEDPNDNQGLGIESFIPAHPYATPVYAYENEQETFGLSYGDHWFGCVAGDDAIAEISVGRLPARNSEEAAVMVNKIIDAEENPDTGDWKSKALFINGGYNPEEEVIFDNTSEHIVSEYRDGGSSNNPRVYMSPSTPELSQYRGGKESVIEAIEDGVGLINYLGHAAGQTWDVLFDTEDLKSLTNRQRLPFVMSMTCWTAAFTGKKDTLGEAFVKSGQGGASAFFGSTSAGLTAGDSLLAIEMFREMKNADGTQKTIGKTIDRAKASIIEKYPAYIEFIQTYTLLGDPAMQLK